MATMDTLLRCSLPWTPSCRCSCSPIDPPSLLPLDARSYRYPVPLDRHASSLYAFGHAFKSRESRLKHPRWVCLARSPGPGDDGQEPLRSDANGNGNGNGKDDDEDVEQALHLDGEIPATSDGFLNQVSSRAYDMRRQLEQSIDAISYDVLEANPWREDSKPVYVLAQEENQILTMRTRRARSEVERELGLLFPKRGSRRGKNGLPRTSLDQSSQTVFDSSGDTRFRMLVEDIREGVLVFEDEDEANQYCSLLEGQGQSCMGVAELNASDVFALCQKIKALAVLFRRGRTPPLPDRLQQNLKARKRSLEDQL